MLPHSGIEIVVNRGEIQAVIDRQQHKGNDEIAEQLANDNLEIAERVATDRAGNTDEGHAAERGTHHAKSDKHPVTFAVADEK